MRLDREKAYKVSALFTVEEVRKRWVGAFEKDYLELEEKGLLHPLRTVDRNINSQEFGLFISTNFNSEPFYINRGRPKLNLEDWEKFRNGVTHFFKKDIIYIEKKYPQLRGEIPSESLEPALENTQIKGFETLLGGVENLEPFRSNYNTQGNNSDIENIKTQQENDIKIKELETVLATLEEHIKKYGAIDKVIELSLQGKSNEDIAFFLKQKNLSHSNIGALLHDNPFTVGNEALMQHAKRLLKK